MRIQFKQQFPDLPLPKGAYFSAFEEVYRGIFGYGSASFSKRVNRFFSELHPLVNAVQKKHRRQSVKGVFTRLKDAMVKRHIHLDADFLATLQQELEVMSPKIRERFDVEQYLNTVQDVQIERNLWRAHVHLAFKKAHLPKHACESFLKDNLAWNEDALLHFIGACEHERDLLKCVGGSETAIESDIFVPTFTYE